MAMQKVKGVNWSEVLRGRIKEVARRHSRHNKIKALLSTQKLSRPSAKGFESTREIRKWRDRRHGQVRG